MKSGIGKFKWRTGEIYDGEWKDDMMHGVGNIIDKMGEKRRIQFKMNAIEDIE